MLSKCGSKPGIPSIILLGVGLFCVSENTKLMLRVFFSVFCRSAYGLHIEIFSSLTRVIVMLSCRWRDPHSTSCCLGILTRFLLATHHWQNILPLYCPYKFMVWIFRVSHVSTDSGRSAKGQAKELLISSHHWAHCRSVFS